VKITVLTTSYPRHEGDPAGNFVADAVDRVRERGVDVEVVSPASFRHFGIAYGAGVVGNLRRQPWRAALVPPMLGSFSLAAARDPLAARVRPLAWGLTAALVGTMAANVFYLTMSFLYFYVFAMIVLVTPSVFARR
jgi:hypothetical protein